MCDIISEMRGSLKLGVKFEMFAQDNFYHPFGHSDKDAAEIEYIMHNDKIPDNIEYYSDLAAHFSVAELAKFLDNYFKKFDNLTITRKILEYQDQVECDWLIDCTGFKRAFVNKYYDDNFVSIQDKIPNDRALVFRTKIPDDMRLPYTTCIGMQHGWVWNIPLKDEIGIGYVHQSKYDVHDEFLDYIQEKGFKATKENIREVNMVTGRNKHHYKEMPDKQIVSIGLSSSFIEPMEATGLYMTVFGIRQLDLLMNGHITPIEYETAVNHEFDTIVEFIVAHYKYSTRTGEYWDQYKDVPCTVYTTNNLFPTRSWTYILRLNKPKIIAEKIVKLRHGKQYKEWLNEKYPR